MLALRCRNSNRGAYLYDEVFTEAWDWIDAVQIGAGYAASPYKLDNTSKPDIIIARRLVANHALRLKEINGQCPPKNYASWLADYVKTLGEMYSLAIGERLVKSVNEDANKV